MNLDIIGGGFIDFNDDKERERLLNISRNGFYPGVRDLDTALRLFEEPTGAEANAEFEV